MKAAQVWLNWRKQVSAHLAATIVHHIRSYSRRMVAGKSLRQPVDENPPLIGIQAREGEKKQGAYLH